MTHTPTEHPVKQGFAAGTSVAAGALLVVIGLLSVLQGISAVAKDEVLVTGVEYVYKFDTTIWGGVHILVGALLLAAGVGLFTGATWARIVTIIAASMSILTNFLWLPYYPAWSIVLIAIAVVVIWAVATWSPDRR
ncbi:hypothetical protein OG921_16415 [Aldersonia sp. NBC_00410]|uniref:DUF7144 family membrane protein n=1 Tax=Aldersonia sp. NBC_00410 TaxID=2975954 RepID=UPI00224E60D0|nr:hypothetical protein [Aldersonia sp. NBC_00410]MCX5044750.1 hypothetical protein [Aldersonia sp. NBC_00410]